ncbi:YggS family pyridoxal phosphate-dependent enzyme [Patescibacteria group bacterium]|nr:YggS family pyridoxal phosphate-dependent enzyme [Patescibacteria group bacterium]
MLYLLQIYHIRMGISNIKSEIDEGITIVAVTKNRSIDEINGLIKSGITDIGENRWQEAKEKIDLIPTGVTKHFIGHLQTNKVREVVTAFDMIQSVDSLKLAQKISDECGKIAKTMPILIQVNTSNEPQKSGIAPGEALNLAKKASELANIKVQGLMTIGVNSSDEEEVRACFKLLKDLFDEIKNSSFEFRTSSFEFISMGMSFDYKIAIQEGANMVRIGRKLFD